MITTQRVTVFLLLTSALFFTGCSDSTGNSSNGPSVGQVSKAVQKAFKEDNDVRSMRLNQDLTIVNANLKLDDFGPGFAHEGGLVYSFTASYEVPGQGRTNDRAQAFVAKATDGNWYLKEITVSMWSPCRINPPIVVK